MPRLSRAAAAYLKSRNDRLAQLNARQPGEPIPPANDAKTLEIALARRAKALTAQHNGDVWESSILSQSAIHGICLFKIPTGRRFVRGGDTVGVKTPFDFFGMVAPQAGRSIVFDAKSVANNSKKQSLGIGMGVVPDHQAISLIRAGEYGAISGLLVCCGPRHDVRWLNWRNLRIGHAIAWDDPAWEILNSSDEPIGFGRLLAVEPAMV